MVPRLAGIVVCFAVRLRSCVQALLCQKR